MGETHVERFQRVIDAGYDHICLHRIGGGQAVALDLDGNEILPSFDRATARGGPGADSQSSSPSSSRA